MVDKTGSISGGGLELYWQAWLPQDIKAFVLLVHGFGEHGGRYSNVVEQLVPVGFALWAIDHKGHGRSQGRRGYVGAFSEYVEDLSRFYREVVDPERGQLPCFLLGHSMGSIIAMNYVAENSGDLSGCILSGTGAASPLSEKKILGAITAMLSKVLPGGSIKFPLPPEFISRDLQVVAAYKDDALVHDRLSFRLAREMALALKAGVRAIQGVNLPILIQCGSEDQSFIGQQELFDGLQTEDKTLKVYPGLKHEVYNELAADRQKVLTDLSAWLESHL